MPAGGLSADIVMKKQQKEEKKEKKMVREYLIAEILHADKEDIEYFIKKTLNPETLEEDVAEKAAEMSKEELHDYDGYFLWCGYNRLRALLGQVIDHVAVARNTEEQIGELIAMGFDKYDLKAHGYSEEDIRDYFENSEEVF